MLGWVQFYAPKYIKSIRWFIIAVSNRSQIFRCCLHKIKTNKINYKNKFRPKKKVNAFNFLDFNYHRLTRAKRISPTSYILYHQFLIIKMRAKYVISKIP